MALDVPMPKLGLTMEEATIIEWLVADGAHVDNEQPIMLIETDKTAYLTVDPAWEPGILGGTPGRFSMASLVRFARGEEPE